MKKLAYEIANNVEETIKQNTNNSDKGKILRIGADGTPTKLIDEIAEKKALEIINNNGKKYNILSEECGFINNNSENTIILDPVDGTYNAVNNIPFYSISIAFGKKNLSDVEYGLVRNLVNGDTFEARKGDGAFYNNNEIQVKPIKKQPTYSIYMGNSTANKNYEIAKIPRRVRALGSAALEICMVANGSLDLSYYVNKDKKRRLRIIDIAAAVLILREAGGEVYNENFEKVEMGINLNERTNVIAVSDQKILEGIK